MHFPSVTPSHDWQSPSSDLVTADDAYGADASLLTGFIPRPANRRGVVGSDGPRQTELNSR
jgi:hypothetical protein